MINDEDNNNNWDKQRRVQKKSENKYTMQMEQTKMVSHWVFFIFINL